MINFILDAYEKKKRDIFPYEKTWEKSTWIDKVYLLFVSACAILTMLFSFYKNVQAILIIACIMVIFGIIFTIAARSNNRKTWRRNVDEYNEKIDIVKEVLNTPGIQIDNKIKIKQLIRKYNIDIERIKEKNTNRENNYKKFSSNYIIPIIAFGAGRICEDMNTNNMLSFCILGVIMVLALKIVLYSVSIMQNQIIEGDELARKRDFVLKLQDLLDRDYDIEEEDLI